jgi:hypothetical protein
MSISSGHNPKQNNMSKLEIAATIANVINIIICGHLVLSLIDHTPAPFYYFYIICATLIVNAAQAFAVTRSTK